MHDFMCLRTLTEQDGVQQLWLLRLIRRTRPHGELLDLGEEFLCELIITSRMSDRYVLCLVRSDERCVCLHIALIRIFAVRR